MDAINDLDPHWIWFALGLLLGAAEILVPGVFLIWLGAAAIITGFAALLLPLGLPLQIVIFAVLAIVAVYAGKRYVRDNPIAEADPLMNRRGARLVGEKAVVVVAIEDGDGKVKLGDSEWLARGPDAPVGTRMRVVGSEGATLLVEPLAAAVAAQIEALEQGPG